MPCPGESGPAPPPVSSEAERQIRDARRARWRETALAEEPSRGRLGARPSRGRVRARCARENSQRPRPVDTEIADVAPAGDGYETRSAVESRFRTYGWPALTELRPMVSDQTVSKLSIASLMHTSDGSEP